MTESEWLTSSAVNSMVGHLESLRIHRFKKGQRRLRLFTAACCRLIWDIMTDERAQKAVSLAERYADGEVTKPDMKAAHKAQADAFGYVLRFSHQFTPEYCAADCAHAATISLLYPNGSGGARFGTQYVRFAAEFGSRVGAGFPREGESAKHQAQLLREVFGNPFRPVTIDPALRRWQGGALESLAQAAYDERSLPSGQLDSARLGILADALEDAGCTDEAILGHLRSPGPHIRGCWVVDDILGKR